VSPTPAASTVYTAYVGEQTCIDLYASAVVASAQSPPDVDVAAVTEGVPGSYPLNSSDTTASAVFAFPYDKPNFPLAGTLGARTVTEAGGAKTASRSYCVTPAARAACAHTLCFAATEDGSHGDVRCYKVEVHNKVLQVGGAGAKAEAPAVSTLVTPAGGFAMAAYVKVGCDSSSAERNETVLAFTSGRTEGLETRNAIMWNEDAADKGSFFYYDCHRGTVFTPRRFCCGTWHFVAVSVGEDDQAVLYVDGESDVLASSLAESLAAAVPFSTASRPDNNLDGAGMGSFEMGPGMSGALDDVSVFNTALSAQEVQELRAAGAVEGTPSVASFTMSGAFVPPNITGSVAAVHMTYPGLTPCVLGLEHAIGPTAGRCPSKVHGWGFAPGLAAKVRFGDAEVRAEYVSPTEVRVETPASHPRYVDVAASNDGVSFTSAEAVGKAVRHLYMESALHLSGNGNGGAVLDGVCGDLPTQAVTFGAWVCPGCGPGTS